MKALSWVQELGRTYSKRPLDSLSDEELMMAIHNSDQRAFAAFYERHKDGLYFFLKRFLGRADLCEEVMQESFLKFYETRARYNSLMSKPRTWLYNIARNTAVDVLRKRTETNWGDVDQNFESYDQELFIDESLEMRLIAKCEKEELQLCIARLVPNQREAILLWMQEISYEEMAQVTGKSAQAMKNLVNRARAGLVEMLVPNVPLELK